VLKRIFGVIALVVAAMLIYGATRADTFSIERNATIAAPPHKLFALDQAAS